MSSFASTRLLDQDEPGVGSARRDEIPKILEFLRLAERLKFELRHSWLSNGRQESVAEHTWQMALMAMLIQPRLSKPVDLGKTLQLILVHDLVEAISGDVPYFDEEGRREKPLKERAAIREIRDMLPADIGGTIFDLWYEFEHATSPEAKFAQALDKLEVQIQHNLADIENWIPIEFELAFTKLQRPCRHDAFLKSVADAVEEQAETKLKASGLDTDAIKAKCGPTVER